MVVGETVVGDAAAFGSAARVVTGAPVELRFDAFQPGGDTAASRPALIWVHGGGFLAGDRTGTNQIATEYAQRGYVTFSIDYRLDPGNRCAELQAGLITNPTEKARETARCRAAIAAAQHDALRSKTVPSSGPVEATTSAPFTPQSFCAA